MGEIVDLLTIVHIANPVMASPETRSKSLSFVAVAAVLYDEMKGSLVRVVDVKFPCGESPESV